jgi:hypothetical protein
MFISEERLSALGSIAASENSYQYQELKLPSTIDDVEKLNNDAVKESLSKIVPGMSEITRNMLFRRLFRFLEEQDSLNGEENQRSSIARTSEFKKWETSVGRVFSLLKKGKNRVFNEYPPIDEDIMNRRILEAYVSFREWISDNESIFNNQDNQSAPHNFLEYISARWNGRVHDTPYPEWRPFGLSFQNSDDLKQYQADNKDHYKWTKYGKTPNAVQIAIHTAFQYAQNGKFE